MAADDREEGKNNKEALKELMAQLKKASEKKRNSSGTDLPFSLATKCSNSGPGPTNGQVLPKSVSSSPFSVDGCLMLGNRYGDVEQLANLSTIPFLYESCPFF
uniref:Uncharacterized protein n=1 Tax=Globodera rostochiensis TaxID=31243 RepID=A0A914HWM6_GLORO